MIMMHKEEKMTAQLAITEKRILKKKRLENLRKDEEIKEESKY